MGLLSRIKQALGFGVVLESPTPKTITPDMVISDDPLIREVIARCWNAGKPIVGRVDEYGLITYEEVDPDGEDKPGVFERVRDGGTGSRDSTP